MTNAERISGQDIQIGDELMLHHASGDPYWDHRFKVYEINKMSAYDINTITQTGHILRAHLCSNWDTYPGVKRYWTRLCKYVPYDPEQQPFDDNDI
jgi:hypothetical protein